MHASCRALQPTVHVETAHRTKAAMGLDRLWSCVGYDGTGPLGARRAGPDHRNTSGEYTHDSFGSSTFPASFSRPGNIPDNYYY